MKRLVVFGATGGTGRALVEQALAAGHAVTAVARRPEAVAVTHPRLVVRRGDVGDAGDVAAAVAGHDAVLSALGARGLGRTRVCADGVAHMLAAMQASGVRRIVAVSATGIGEGALLPWPVRVFMRLVLQPVLRHPYADLRRMEATLRASAVDWTIVRPPRLTHDAATGRWRAAIGEPLARAMKISRADLAAAILAHLDDPATFRTTVEVAH